MAGTQIISYLHADHLNTPRWATNTAKQTVWTWQSDVYGTTMANEDPRNTGTKTTVPLRFPGQYFDEETGFHYNYFRTYIPDFGRYSQSDPIGLEAGWNTFAYVDGNPLRWADYRGLQTLDTASNACLRQPALCPELNGLGKMKLPTTYPSARNDSNDKQCPPCEPPAGTIGYEGPYFGHCHDPYGEGHYHLTQRNQNLETCECFWNKANPDTTDKFDPSWLDRNGKIK